MISTLFPQPGQKLILTQGSREGLFKKSHEATFCYFTNIHRGVSFMANCLVIYDDDIFEMAICPATDRFNPTVDELVSHLAKTIDYAVTYQPVYIEDSHIDTLYKYKAMAVFLSYLASAFHTASVRSPLAPMDGFIDSLRGMRVSSALEERSGFSRVVYQELERKITFTQEKLMRCYAVMAPQILGYQDDVARTEGFITNNLIANTMKSDDSMPKRVKRMAAERYAKVRRDSYSMLRSISLENRGGPQISR